jgi:ribosomal protein L19E
MSTTKKKNKKTKKSQTAQQQVSPWSHFWTVLTATLVFFWVLFPLYSYQLQVILDQRQCKGQSSDDSSQGGGGKCMLPNHQHQPPYYPCKDGDIRSYPSALPGKKCPVEHVSGPDWFTYIIRLSRTLTKDIYSILVGEVWINADVELLDMEKKLKKSGEGSGEESGESSKSSEESKKGGNIYTGGARGSGGSEWTAEAKATRKKLEKSKAANAVDKENARKAREARKGRAGVNVTGKDMAMEALESSLKFTQRSLMKNKERSLCCSRLKKYGNLSEKEEGCDPHGDSIVNYPPFGWIMPKKFGWPYNYIYDDPAVEKPTAYNPDDDNASGTVKWVGAWFAKTQQRSWSASRGIWSDILSFFLPYLHEELSDELINERLEAFITAMNDQLKEDNDRLNKKGGDKEGNQVAGATKEDEQKKSVPHIRKNLTQPFDDRLAKVSNERAKKDLKKFHNDFKKIKEQFNKSAETTENKNKKAIDKLFEVMSKPEGDSYFSRGKSAEKDSDWKGSKEENIFLDFYVAVTKPESLRTYHPMTVLWNFGQGTYKYWFRYLTTLWMPILCMTIMMGSAGTALFYTPFSSVNRYSVFLLPLFFGLGTTLFNMGAQPFEVFLYMLFGAQGKRTSSEQCPYEGGTYQMTRNVKAYWPINLFISLAIIITTLGKTLAASGNSAGVAVSLIFPILIGLRLLFALLLWLWSFK